MATFDDVRRLALAFPGVREVTSYSIGGQPVVWPYFERDKTRRKLTFQPGIWAIRCPVQEKEMLIEAAPEIYLDDDYYRRYDVVLVRLANIDEAELAAMLGRAYDIQAKKARKR
jgi:hypothetical protein